MATNGAIIEPAKGEEIPPEPGTAAPDGVPASPGTVEFTTDELKTSSCPERPTPPALLDNEAPENGLAEATVADSDDSSAVGETEATETPDGVGTDDLVAKLSELETRILEAFERKLAFDGFKEKQLDRLHDELQAYKNDFVGKAVRPVLSSMIKLHGDISRLVRGLRSEDPAKVTIERVFRAFENIRDELEDLLANQGVSKFEEMLDDRFDPRRQSSVGLIPTDDPSFVGRVAERILPGFEQGEAIFEKERVRVYAAARPGAAAATSAPTEQPHVEQPQGDE